MGGSDFALKSIAKGASFAFAGIIISKLLGYIYRLLVARLGPADYGLLSISLAIFNFTGIIVALGLTQGIQRYVPYYLERKEEGKVRGIVFFSMKTTFILGLTAGLILFLLSPWISKFVFHDERLEVLIKVIAFIIPLDVLRNIFLNLCKAYKYIIPEVYARNVGENLSKILLTVVFLFIGLGIVGAVGAYALAIFVSLLISYYYVKKVFSFKSAVRPVYEKKLWFNYSIPLVINHFLLLIMLWTDTLMLGFFRTSSEVGIYNAASPTAQLIYIFPAAILSLFLPVLSSLYSKNDTKSFNSCYSSVTKWIFLINLYFLIFLSLFSEQAITALFGEQYASGALVLAILVLGYFFYHLSLTSNNILMIIDRTRLVFLISLVGAVINLILNYALIPAYGFLGAGIATSISVFVMGMANFLLVWRIINYSPFKISYIKAILCGAVIGLVMNYFKDVLNNYILMIVFAVLWFLVYSLMLLTVKVFDDEDIKILRYIEKGFVNKIISVMKKFIN